MEPIMQSKCKGADAFWMRASALRSTSAGSRKPGTAEVACKPLQHKLKVSSDRLPQALSLSVGYSDPVP